jgi:hypothetical protein
MPTYGCKGAYSVWYDYDQHLEWHSIFRQGMREQQSAPTTFCPEPGVWTGTAQANVWAPLRWKHAKIHRARGDEFSGHIKKPDIRQQL